MNQHTRRLADINIGEELSAITAPLSLYKFVMIAGANRDFNSIHHNSEFAKSSGAPDAYANTLFLMGLWERLAREWAGPSAIITALRGFRMGRFNLLGTTTRTTGRVIRIEPDRIMVTISAQCEDEHGITVGPGEIDLQLPG